MKNPNRKVVVEYKHRRLRKESVSLWGNLDLKSIAKEVDALNLLSSAGENAKPPSIESAHSKSEPCVAEIALELSSSNEISRETQLKQDIPAINNCELQYSTNLQPPQDVATTARNAMVIAKVIRSPRPKESAIEQKAQLVRDIQTDDAVLIELSYLELENSRLKHQLAEKLIEENKHLLKMLQRLRLRMP